MKKTLFTLSLFIGFMSANATEVLPTDITLQYKSVYAGGEYNDVCIIYLNKVNVCETRTTCAPLSLTIAEAKAKNTNIDILEETPDCFLMLVDKNNEATKEIKALKKKVKSLTNALNACQAK